MRDDRLQPGGAIPGDHFGGAIFQDSLSTQEIGIIQQLNGPGLGVPFHQALQGCWLPCQRPRNAEYWGIFPNIAAEKPKIAPKSALATAPDPR